MLFSSIEFIFVFLPVSLILCYIAKGRLKNLALFSVSLIFYGWGEPKYLALMLATIGANFLFGIAISRRGRYARLWLWTAVASNLATLAVFKYLSPTLNALGAEFRQIALPVGISFYTFQSLSYVIDVYRGEKPLRDPIAFGTYVTMFPQLVAGPIVKYGEVSAQLKERRLSSERCACGILRFVCGLGKKLVLANTAGEVWSYFSSLPPQRLSTLGAWFGILFFAFQIYFDFSGYSDMAIGLGLLLGFDFPENFNYPYTAKSFRDFWRRWHISLTSWFREYLYIPLGGNRRGELRTLLNMLAVWAFTGIWHGAALNFLFWGLYCFTLLAAERLFLGRLTEKLPSLLAHAYTLAVILVGWVFFSAQSLGGATAYLARMFTLSAPMGNEGYHVIRHIPFLILLALGSTPLPKKAYAELSRGRARELLPFFSLFLFIVCLAKLVSAAYNPFLYFRF